MRVGQALMRRRGRWPPREPIKFMEMFPLQLQNEVSSKGSKQASTACLEEMAVMFACMKKNEFKEAKCAQETTNFLSCYNNHTAEIVAAKKREESGVITVGRNPRDLTTKQLNQLLKKYPQVNENRKKHLP